MPDARPEIPPPAPIEWAHTPGLVAYPEAVAAMEARVARIAAGEVAEQVWLIEHPSLYTAGTSARDEDLLEPGRLPLIRTGRGGQITYHGPGQRIAYLMLSLARRGLGPRDYVERLERWLIMALEELGVGAVCRRERVGIWVPRGNGREDKIAAIGVRVRRGVAFHGIALNVAPDLSYYKAIVPCGIREHGVTSLRDLGRETAMPVVDAALRRAFEVTFGNRIVDAMPTEPHIGTTAAF
ncbi:MAG: lipoyl(octanoyl) transferase LipB [Hyphomicrobiaceae bacterium]